MSSPSVSGPAPDERVQRIRTLALVGASGSGKTTLSEALLAASGAIPAAGSVERGSTVSDADALERRLHHSLQTTVLHADWRGSRIHWLDTPGAADLVGQSLPALEAVETAAIVIDAAAGIQPITVRMMQYAADRQLDRLIIVNKIDAPEVNLPALLQAIQDAFGRECLPLNLPDAGASRVVDCYFNREGHSDFGAVDAAHRALVEQVVEVDGDVVERYLNEGDIDARELHAPLEQALREGHLIPVCFVSARSGVGLTELLDVIDRLLPNPTEGNPPAFYRDDSDGAGGTHTPVAVRPSPDEHVLAHVFKIHHDPYVGKLAVMRVHQGTVRRDSPLFIGSGRKPFKVGHLYLLQGAGHVEVAHAVPGDIVAVAKVDALRYDDVLHDAAEDDHIHLKPLALPTPVHGVAIAPSRRGDEQKLWDILSRQIEEDPCLRLDSAQGSGANGQTVLYGLGELHLRLVLQRLQEVHKLDVRTSPPRIAYRETVTASSEGHHRHKKQSGGAGQFAEVFLRVEPLARGAGFEFVDAVKGGTIPSQFMPAVEKGVREVLAEGAISGHPVVDVRVVVHDGKHHSVDSKEIAFVTAARKAFRVAILEARPVVLEPIVDVEIQAPAAAMGDITGDLASRRGMVTGTDSAAGAFIVVRGQAPQAELVDYQTRLNALTSGEGRFTVAMAHYDVAPPNLQRTLRDGFPVHDVD